MNYKDINDYELLYMVCECDDFSVEVLLEKYQPLIHKKVLKWKEIARGCSLEIEDLEQEIRCSLLEAVRHYDDYISATFYTYFLRVIDNTIIRVLRNHQTLKQKILNESISLHTPVLDGAYFLQDVIQDPSSIIEERFLKYQLEFEICNFCYDLPVMDAQVFELYLSGYSSKTIAQLLALRYGYVSHLLYKNRKKLKEFLIQKDVLVV